MSGKAGAIGTLFDAALILVALFLGIGILKKYFPGIGNAADQALGNVTGGASQAVLGGAVTAGQGIGTGMADTAESNVDWFDNAFGITAIETWIANTFNLNPPSQPTQTDAQSWLNGTAGGVDPETQSLLDYINGGGQ